MAFAGYPTRYFPWETFNFRHNLQDFSRIANAYPVRDDIVRGGGGGGAVRPGSVRPGPLSQVVTAADQAAVNQLLQQSSRGITASDAQLLEWQLADRLRTNPADDFARVMLGQKKKSRKFLRIGRKLVPKLMRLVPGIGWVATAADAAAALAPLIDASQQAAIGRLVQTLTGKAPATGTGPRTRTKPKTKTQTKREVTTLQLPTYTRERVPIPDPGAIPTPDPSVQVSAKPLASDNPLVSPQATPQPKPATSRAKPGTDLRWRTRTKTANRVKPRIGRSRLSSDQLLRRFAEGQQPGALTQTQPQGGESGDRCECKTQKRPKKKRQPRKVCYRGTYTERASSLSKRKKEKIPCQ